MAFLEINNVSKKFGTTEAVSDFNLHVEKGELVSFLGPSGCGKTTTLRMVAGFEVPTGGRIVMDGRDITDLPPNQRDVGMVFQSYALFPNMTVAGNIGFGLKVMKKPAEEINQRVSEMLELINMPKYAERFPYQLSGGQQQRVALARALALRPEMLLLDEPLSALDAKIRVSLRAEIRSIQQKLGITAIYVTHDQEEALSLSDRVVVMNTGRMEQVGTPFEIYNFPTTSFVANFVGTLNTAEVEVTDPAGGLVGMDGVQFVSSDEHVKSRRKGDKVRISIRPERFSFVTEGEKENVVDCRIENITFLGSVVRIQMTIGNQKFNMDTFNRPSLALPEIGDQRQVTCSSKAVLVLKD
ncbi:MAG: spermidine/putrescine ABC transporter ATP-binding protein [Anaerolineales bacterium]|nr:ABC transporter ATP-binding protein [Anaerolineae bacterium]PWB69029.1 MAG: spermidine/putrescine ABC transporter ATP-binding protein [Anaerolineales bacterium]